MMFFNFACLYLFLKLRQEGSFILFFFTLLQDVLWLTVHTSANHVNDVQVMKNRAVVMLCLSLDELGDNNNDD